MVLKDSGPDPQKEVGNWLSPGLGLTEKHLPMERYRAAWSPQQWAERGGPCLPWAARGPGKARAYVAFRRQRLRFHSRSVYF